MKKTMVITLQESGGFTGITRTKSIDTADLSNVKQQQATHLVEKVNFFALPTVLSDEKESNARDTKEYKLTCTFDKKSHTVHCTDMTKKPLEPFLSWIKETE